MIIPPLMNLAVTLHKTDHLSSGLIALSIMNAPGIRSKQILIKMVTRGRASAVTVFKQVTAGFGAFVFIKTPEIIKYRVLPDFVKVVVKNIAEFKLLIPEKEVTWIHRSIRQDRQLSRTRRAPDIFEYGITLFIRNKTGTVNTVQTTVDAFD
jgi:hypothetical protein